MTLELCLSVMPDFGFVPYILLHVISMPLFLCLMSVIPCPHVSFKFPLVILLLNFHALLCLLCSSLCLPVCSFVPSMHSLCYLTCWSASPVPHLVISTCVFSLCLPCTLCQFIVSVCISSYLRLFTLMFLLLLLSSSSPWLVCFGFEFCIFDLNSVSWLYFVLLPFCCYFAFFVFCTWCSWFLYSALN